MLIMIVINFRLSNLNVYLILFQGFKSLIFKIFFLMQRWKTELFIEVTNLESVILMSFHKVVFKSFVIKV